MYIYFLNNTEPLGLVFKQVRPCRRPISISVQLMGRRDAPVSCSRAAPSLVCNLKFSEWPIDINNPVVF